LADYDPLVNELIALGRHVVFPPTPDFAGAFHARVRRRRRPFGRAGLLAIAAVLIIGAGGATALAAGWLGVRHVNVVTTSHPPTIKPRPGGVVAQLTETGARQVTLSEARRLTDGLPRLPSALGEPDGVYLAKNGDLSIVYAVYRPRPGLPATVDPEVGLLLTEFVSSSGDNAVIDKLLGSGAIVTSVTVNGSPGYWITGAEHFTAPADEPAALRASGDVLIWEQSGVLIRMEVALPETATIELARSIPG
jgi:hypothetical protein